MTPLTGRVFVVLTVRTHSEGEKRISVVCVFGIFSNHLRFVLGLKRYINMERKKLKKSFLTSKCFTILFICKTFEIET